MQRPPAVATLRIVPSGHPPTVACAPTAELPGGVVGARCNVPQHRDTRRWWHVPPPRDVPIHWDIRRRCPMPPPRDVGRVWSHWLPRGDIFPFAWLIDAPVPALGVYVLINQHKQGYNPVSRGSVVNQFVRKLFGYLTGWGHVATGHVATCPYIGMSTDGGVCPQPRDVPQQCHIPQQCNVHRRQHCELSRRGTLQRAPTSEHPPTVPNAPHHATCPYIGTSPYVGTSTDGGVCPHRGIAGRFRGGTLQRAPTSEHPPTVPRAPHHATCPHNPDPIR